ncbi:hypothetical protein [uncultured Arthrobacter sp.]|uniref:hypothetical protein n=1 Tax=uncultured Arthrobacter sp. TaxID=114050 RepID=UPI002602A186|nr:hypothetical protein [uncultured Arthrobacter sp.]
MAVISIPAPALLLQHSGLNKVWLGWWVIAWTAAVLSARVAIPRIDPGVSSASSALEQLGAIGLCVPLVLVAILIPDRTTWLTASSPRNPRLLRLANIGLITAVSVSSAMAAAALYPSDIRWIRIVSIFMLLLALTFIAALIIGSTWAGFLAPAFIILNTIPGLISWKWNVIYNPATDAALIPAAFLSLSAVFLVLIAHTAFSHRQPSRGTQPAN